jgi:glycosyltransferase involved in cell wall biosynthesis
MAITPPRAQIGGEHIANIPQISVIIPIYNTGIKLKKCLNSILNQSFTDFECLMIDDGSTDVLTINLCIQYANKDTRFKYFQKENEGVERTRVYGVKKAIGDYIMFSDHDDYYDLGAFQKLLNKAYNSGSDIVVANNYEKYSTCIPLKQKHLGIYTDKDIDPQDFLQNYYCNFFGINLFGVTTWNKLYKRALWTDVQFEYLGFNFFEDIILNIQIFPNAKKISFIKDTLYTHMYGGITSKIDVKNVLNGYLASFDFKTKYLKRYDLLDTYGKYIYYEVKNVILQMVGKMIEAQTYSKEAFIEILSNFRETGQFEQLAAFYAGNQPTVLLMENRNFDKIYDDAILEYKKNYLKFCLKRLIQKIIA